MSVLDQPWYYHWFNEDYLKFYAHRDAKEAEQQVDFIIKALRLSGNERILDVGCGWGRHALALAQRHWHVVAIDQSPFLIRTAKEAASSTPNLPVKFQIADIRNFKDDHLFDVVLNLFTSFGYFDDDDENFAIIGNMRAQLVVEGLLVLDYLHPDAVRSGLIPYEEQSIDDVSIKIYRTIEDDSIIKTIVFPHQQYQERVKLYSRDRLEVMFTEQGCKVVEVWNDYQGNPWKTHGDRQIFHCRAV